MTAPNDFPAPDRTSPTAPVGGSFPLPWVFDDGGRAAAGFRGKAADCVVRAVAIAASLPYADVYAAVQAGGATERRSAAAKGPRSSPARVGVRTKRKWFRDYMRSIGFVWTPCMQVGAGCRVHLRAGELPLGRLVVKTSRHLCAVIDGVIRDTHDPARGGSRCVYGFWTAGGAS